MCICALLLLDSDRITGISITRSISRGKNILSPAKKEEEIEGNKRKLKMSGNTSLLSEMSITDFDS